VGLVVAAVKASDLLEVVWVSLLAGVTVCVLFAFVVLFGARSAESRREGSAGASLTYAIVTAVTLAAFGGVVAYGVHIMLSKG
jgi:hypothetical protein